MNAYGVISIGAAVAAAGLAPSCSSFLPVLNPVVIPGLRAGTCAVLRGSLLIVSLCWLSAMSRL